MQGLNKGQSTRRSVLLWVPFDGKETAARLFVTLAAKDNDSHMDALVKISELLSDDDKVEKILAASDVQTLYHYFECV